MQGLVVLLVAEADNQLIETLRSIASEIECENAAGRRMKDWNYGGDEANGTRTDVQLCDDLPDNIQTPYQLCSVSYYDGEGKNEA